MKKKKYLILFLIFLVIAPSLPNVMAYDMSVTSPIHQHITNESRDLWRLIPNEIKEHLTSPLNENKDSYNSNYNAGDDIIDGSSEEDITFGFVGLLESLSGFRTRHHFWQPDMPNSLISTGSDDYNEGLTFVLQFSSSYRTAIDYWNTEVIPSYLSGNLGRSYYYLGRVAHLLEDAAQPSHVHLDSHIPNDFSILENYTSSNYSSLKNTYSWQGENFDPYYYEELLWNFNWTNQAKWRDIEPKRDPDRDYPFLFRLFWYTAQKMQYWASDDREGNLTYTLLNGTVRSFACGGTGPNNLWANETGHNYAYTSCNEFVNQRRRTI